MSKDYDTENFAAFAEDVRIILADLEATMLFVSKIVDDRNAEHQAKGWDESVRNMWMQTAKDLLDDSFNFIHEYAESPIEILFLGALGISCAMYNPLSFVFTPPLNVAEFSSGLRKDYEGSLEMWNYFQKETGKKDISVFADTLEMADVSSKQVAHILRYILVYDTLDLYNGFHFTLQPEMDVKVNGKKIRPDLYIWIPSKPDFKLIVECDGFAHHSNRKAFSNDRVRDRELQRHGYQVLRYSGHEIYHNPAGKGIELFNYLMEIKGAKKQ